MSRAVLINNAGPAGDRSRKLNVASRSCGTIIIGLQPVIRQVNRGISSIKDLKILVIAAAFHVFGDKQILNIRAREDIQPIGSGVVHGSPIGCETCGADIGGGQCRWSLWGGSAGNASTAGNCFVRSTRGGQGDVPVEVFSNVETSFQAYIDCRGRNAGFCWRKHDRSAKAAARRSRYFKLSRSGQIDV